MGEDPITLFSKLADRYPRKRGVDKVRHVVIDALRALPEKWSHVRHAALYYPHFLDPYQERVEEWNREVADVSPVPAPPRHIPARTCRHWVAGFVSLTLSATTHPFIPGIS